MIETKPHPLVNKSDSPHYDSKEPGEKTFIEKFEQQYTIRQIHNWCLITIDKYIYRIGSKDDEDKEMRKIKTYTDYSVMLKKIIDSYPMLSDMTAKTAYQHLNYHWRY